MQDDADLMYPKLLDRTPEDDLASLRTKVKEQIGKDYGQLTRARMKRGLLDQLADGHDFPVPAGMADAEYNVIWEQIQKDKEEDKLDPEDKDKSDEELQGEYRKIAERRVRLGLLLSEVGRSNGIDVSQEEVNRALMAEAQRYFARACGLDTDALGAEDAIRLAAERELRLSDIRRRGR